MGNSLLKIQRAFYCLEEIYRNRLMFEFLSQNILSIYVKKWMIILSPVYNLYTIVRGDGEYM